MTITHRGVQAPGYYDQDRKEFFHVDDMVPEIIVPDLKDCKVNKQINVFFFVFIFILIFLFVDT